MNESNMMFKQSVFFDENHELNDTGILLYVDALRLNRENDLPDVLVEHVANSAKDLKRIYEYYEFVKDDDTSELTPHPYFDKSYQSNTPIKALRNRQIMKIAAAIILLLGVSYLVYVMSGNEKSKAGGGQIGKNEDSTQQKPPTIVDSNNLTKTKNTSFADTTEKEKTLPIAKEKTPQVPQNPRPFEEVFSNTEIQAMQIKYIDDRLGQTTRSESLKVVYPLINTKIKAPTFSFRWENPIEDSLRLEIFTKNTQEQNKRIIYKIAPRDSTFTIPKPLKPFLYYWELKKIMDNGRKKTIKKGKFLMEKRKK